MRLPWTPEEDAIVRALFPVNDDGVVGKLIDRSPSAVANRAVALGLRKDPAYTAQTCARFKPGQAAWNKGTKGVVGVQAGCRATQFKPGRKPHESRNYRPVGSERITRDGQLERKVTDDTSVYPAKRWVAVTRLVWEAANGPVPAGHAVAFKAGRKATDAARITTDVLELVSRRELMLRNSRHTRYPPEVNQLIQLAGALKRKINNRKQPA